MAPRKKKPKAQEVHLEHVDLDTIPVQQPPRGDELERILFEAVTRIAERCQLDAVQLVASQPIANAGGDTNIVVAGLGNVLTRRALLEAYLDGPPPAEQQEEF